LYLINDHSMASIVILVLGIAVLNLIFGARLTVPQRPAHQQPEQTSASHEQRGMWWAALLIPSAVILLASMSVGAFITFLPLYLGAASSGLASGFFAAKAVLMVSGRFIGRRWTSAAHAQWVVVGSVVAAALAPALLLASDAPALVLLAGMVHGLAFALLYPTLLTEVSFAVPTRQQGFGVGIFIGAADLGVALGSLALGVVAQYWSYGAVFGASAFAALLALALLGCRSLVTKLPPVAQAD
jgi:predicted MFS family arabinose efflux permease